MEGPSYYCLFEGPSEGMMLHKRLRELNVPHHVCPSPRHISESCGIALKFRFASLCQVAQQASDLNIRVTIISEEGRLVEP